MQIKSCNLTYKQLVSNDQTTVFCNIDCRIPMHSDSHSESHNIYNAVINTKHKVTGYM